jgi:uncharacterized protein YjiS (DUF1127 family)
MLATNRIQSDIARIPAGPNLAALRLMEAAMNATQTVTYPRTEALAEVFDGAWRRLAGALSVLAEARGRARAVRDLERLSDRALYDIGLHRSQIHAAVYEGRR